MWHIAVNMLSQVGLMEWRAWMAHGPCGCKGEGWMGPPAASAGRTKDY